MPDGTSYIDHLKAIQKMTGQPQKELKADAEMPVLAAPVWGWFVKLASKRGSNGFGPSPISYTEMEAFFRLNDIEASPWEVELICKFDDIALQQYAEDYEKKRKAESKASKNKSHRKR